MAGRYPVAYYPSPVTALRQQVLKALSNPPRIFYVPYSIAVLNFAVQFIIFVVLLTVTLAINGITGFAGGVYMPDLPLYFLVSVVVVHLILAAFSKREPQLANIVAAKLQLFKSKVPNQLNP